jgi:HAD superfamily hydrolase (TIGR01509 family)
MGIDPAAIRAVIFDVDGLIVDTEEIYYDTFNRTLGEFGHSLPREAYTEFVGIPVEQNSSDVVTRYKLDVTPEVFTERWMDHFEETISDPDRIALRPGILALLNRLRGRLPLAIASSTHRPRMLKTLQNGLLTRLDAKSLDEVFTVIVSGSDVPENKPAPDIYLRAASLLDIDPSSCLVFEDSEAGVSAGRSAGMSVIAVPNFFTAHQDHSGASLVLQSLEEAVGLFE